MLETFLDNFKLKPDKRNEIITDLRKKQTLEEISDHIKVLKGDIRAMVFAWQCVTQDNEIKDSEVQAFHELMKFFKVKESEIENIKEKARKFSLLKDVQMIDEYFK